MENSKWKLGAKIVAYFDLITSIISLVLLGGTGVLVLIESTNEDSLTVKSSVPGSYFRLIFALAFTYLGIVLWATLQLLQAVKEGVDKDVALRKAKIWRNVHIVLLIIGAIGAVSNLQLASGVGVVVRGIFIFIVWKFIATLKYQRSVFLQTTVDFTTGNEKEVPYGLLIV